LTIDGLDIRTLIWDNIAANWDRPQCRSVLGTADNIRMYPERSRIDRPLTKLRAGVSDTNATMARNIGEGDWLEPSGWPAHENGEARDFRWDSASSWH
jgi:hypothetical protein